MAPRQAAAVPFRQLGDRFEVCLITTTGSRKWSIPKGFIDPGDSASETAAREAWEEAGLHGRVVGGPVGYYDITKFGVAMSVVVYLLEVERVDDEWEEQAFRDRRWASPGVAENLLHGRPVGEVFRRAIAELGGGAHAASSK